MVKKFLLCFLFFGLSPLLLGLSIYLANFPFEQGKVLGENILLSQKPNDFFAPQVQETSVIVPSIKAEDSTLIIIENYLAHYRSPLLPYAQKIVETARKYGVKPQLIVAIAQQESNLGKKSPENCFNAWGWAIHERGTLCFKDWEEAIETVTKGIARNYCAKGYCEDPCLMMAKYTPKSNGSWCVGVNQFLKEMETNF